MWRRIGWRDGIALGLIGACLAIELGLLRVGIDDLDEGYFAQQGWRVAQGQVPFRDFETLYAPGLAYLHAALFAASGGPNLLAMRALALAGRAGLALAMYGMARPFVRNPLWAALPAVFVLVALDDAPERWEPHPGWLSALFALLAAWVICRGAAPRSLLLAGALCAASFAFKQNTGLFMLAAIVIWLRMRAAPAVVAFAVLTALWLVPLALSVGDVRKLGPLVGLVNQAGLISPPEPSILVALACLAAAVWLKHTWYLIAGLALFATQFPRMDTLHLAWSAAILLVLGAVALERVPIAARVATFAGLALLAWPMLVARVDFVRLPRAPIFNVEAPMQTAEDLADTVADIQARTRPGEPIFVYPTSPLLYALSQRSNPTRFDHLNPGAATPTQLQTVQKDLENADVKVVVISDFWQQAWGDPQANQALEDWLASHFVNAAQHGAYRVLAPR